jgi:hypothetical protein
MESHHDLVSLPPTTRFLYSSIVPSSLIHLPLSPSHVVSSTNATPIIIFIFVSAKTPPSHSHTTIHGHGFLFMDIKNSPLWLIFVFRVFIKFLYGFYSCVGGDHPQGIKRRLHNTVNGGVQTFCIRRLAPNSITVIYHVILTLPIDFGSVN